MRTRYRGPRVVCLGTVGESKVVRSKARMFGDTCEHFRTDFISVMKCEDHIGPTWTSENSVRTGLAFNSPADSKQRSENAVRFGGRPLAHAVAKEMSTN